MSEQRGGSGGRLFARACRGRDRQCAQDTAVSFCTCGFLGRSCRYRCRSSKYMCLVSRLRKSWADEGKCLYEGMREGVKAVSVTSRYSSGHKCCTALRWLAVCLSFHSCNPTRCTRRGGLCQLPREVCAWPERSCVVTTLL